MKSVCFVVALLSVSCGGGSTGSPTAPSVSSTSLPPGPGALSFAPISLSAALWCMPMGGLNPPGHTLPSDHGGCAISDPDIPHPGGVGFTGPDLVVVAPGGGLVLTILSRTTGAPDFKIEVAMSSTFTYYIDHIVLDSGIGVGSTLTAGQRIGHTGTNHQAIDLGVYNYQAPLPFVTPSRYGAGLYADGAFKYFTEPVRSQIYAKVRRNSSDKDGRICFDVAGRLSGGWFEQSMPLQFNQMNPADFNKELAFVYDSIEPSLPVIAMGGFEGLPGVWYPWTDDPDFSKVSPSSGVVAYHLLQQPNPGSSFYFALLLVQMTDDSHLKVQVFPGFGASVTGFTDSALTYVR